MNADTSTTSTNKPTTKDYVYRFSAAVANAILVTLGIGLLFQTIAQFIHWQPLYDAGTMGTVLLAPALGVAVASQLDVNTLVIFSAMISSTVGSNAVHFTTKAVNGTSAVGGTLLQAAGSPSFSTGQPVSAVAAALIAALVGKYLTGKTPLDMVLVILGQQPPERFQAWDLLPLQRRSCLISVDSLSNPCTSIRSWGLSAFRLHGHYS